LITWKKLESDNLAGIVQPGRLRIVFSEISVRVMQIYELRAVPKERSSPYPSQRQYSLSSTTARFVPRDALMPNVVIGNSEGLDPLKNGDGI
jgi:hypothetical protein